MTKMLGFKALALATGMSLSLVLVSGCNPEEPAKTATPPSESACGQACPQRHRCTSRPCPEGRGQDEVTRRGHPGLAEVDRCDFRVGWMNCTLRAVFPGGNAAFFVLRAVQFTPSWLDDGRDEAASPNSAHGSILPAPPG